ncbi:MAG TPA: lipoyl domain-containing protein, partial [Candidatus Dormibacteraeota bacterium]|nr:lipoyl domain-containing protein [Candidatus Dormibacteraeota bacterium]
MSADVIMPALGMNQDTGRVVAWLKAEGDVVARGEPIMEIETDKATVEVEAPADGVLSAISARPGDEVPVGQRVAVVLAPGEALDAGAGPPGEPHRRRPPA